MCLGHSQRRAKCNESVNTRPGPTFNSPKMCSRHSETNHKRNIIFHIVPIVLCCVFFTFTFSVARAEEKPQSLEDLFNTTSCIDQPYTCPHPRIQFYLYTRRTQQSPELLDVRKLESLYISQFNRLHPTKIVVHGFGGGRNFSPSTDMRAAYFRRGNYNIIIVDYSTLAKEPCLSQMYWAPRFCARCIAQLVHYLSTHPRGVRADALHLIGYSVGAHISGLVANYLDKDADGKLGRITGLDPTIVFYSGNNSSRDLDASDAHFVDVLHTGAGILGQWGPSGHADFYINGGTSQPGCSRDTIFQTLSCDHTRVSPLFIESINSRAGFWAYPCNTLLAYILGICSPKDSDYVLMGEHVSRKARGVYYVATNPEPPFAQGPPDKFRRLIRTRRWQPDLGESYTFHLGTMRT